MEEDVLNLQESVKKGEAREEMIRFMQVHQERCQSAQTFQMASDNEGAEDDIDEEKFVWGFQPEGHTHADASGDRTRTFFPSSSAKDIVPKVPPIQKEIKTDQVLSFPNSKMVDEKIEIKPWPSITSDKTYATNESRDLLEG